MKKINIKIIRKGISILMILLALLFTACLAENGGEGISTPASLPINPVNPTPSNSMGIKIIPGTLLENRTGFSLQWNAPSSFGTDDVGRAILRSAIRYIVHYVQGDKKLYDTPPKILQSASKVSLPSIPGYKKYLDVDITGLKENTSYVVVIEIKRRRDTVISYSDPVELTTTASETDRNVGLGKARSVWISRMAKGDKSFIVTWSAPKPLGTNADGIPVVSTAIEYIVYCSEYTVNALDTLNKIQTFISTSSAIKKTVAGDTGDTVLVGDTTFITVTFDSLKPDTRYVVVVVTKHKDDPTKVSYSDVRETTTKKPPLQGDSLAYESLTFNYNATKSYTATPKTTPDGSDLAYTIRYTFTGFFPAAVDPKITAIHPNTGTVTVKPGVIAGRYEYTITVSKETFEPQTARLTVIVNLIDPAPAGDVRLKAGTLDISEFVVQWEKPQHFGGAKHADNIRYTVYYVEGDKDTFDNTSAMVKNQNVKTTPSINAAAGILESRITGLNPSTSYVFVVEAKNIVTSNKDKKSYSTFTSVITKDR